MGGIDRHTLKPISNLQSAYQGVEVTLSTTIGDMVMLREFGGGVTELLGRLLRPELFALFIQMAATAIDIWEPRFRVRRMKAKGSIEQVRLGHLSLTIEADYRPRAHLGDFTVESLRTFSLFLDSRRVEIND